MYFATGPNATDAAATPGPRAARGTWRDIGAGAARANATSGAREFPAGRGPKARSRRAVMRPHSNIAENSARYDPALGANATSPIGWSRSEWDERASGFGRRLFARPTLPLCACVSSSPPVQLDRGPLPSRAPASGRTGARVTMHRPRATTTGSGRASPMGECKSGAHNKMDRFRRALPRRIIITITIIIIVILYSVLHCAPRPRLFALARSLRAADSIRRADYYISSLLDSHESRLETIMKASGARAQHAAATRRPETLG